MSLIDLPTEVFSVLLRHLLTTHHMRLFETGDKIVRHHVVNARRSCSLIFGLTGSKIDVDFCTRTLLMTAADVESDEYFLRDLLALKSAMPTNIRSLSIAAVTVPPRLADDDLVVDMRPLANLHTFVYPIAYCCLKFRLPPSITKLKIGTANPDFVLGLESLIGLSELDVSFSNHEVVTRFLDNAKWPESITDLKLGFVSTRSMACLRKLPPTLTRLKVYGNFFGATDFVFPYQCTSLKLFKLLVPVVQMNTYHLVGLPPSLTCIRMNGLLANGLLNEDRIANVFAAIPSHVTQFSINELRELTAVSDLLPACKSVLPRLGFLDVERLALVSSRYMDGSLRAEFNDAFGRHGFDHRYLDLLMAIRAYPLNPYGTIYDAKLPDSYLDAFLLSKRERLICNAVKLLIGDVEDAGAMEQAEWIFTHTGANRLQIDQSRADVKMIPLSLPLGICENLVYLEMPLTCAMPLASILSKPLPKLLRFTASMAFAPMPINDLAKILHASRYNLPRLESVSYWCSDSISDNAVKMLAEMNLYRFALSNHAHYSVTIPSWALRTYPCLRPVVTDK
jgi:hypothetical protein